MNQRVATIDQLMREAGKRQIIHQSVDDAHDGGRVITMGEHRVTNFGSCSTLGLETHPDLIAGAIEAVQRFGTQFSSSRVYAKLALYDELEDLLRQMFDRPVVVAASTTLGHCAALPTLVGDNDAVIVDMQAHASMQMAVELLRARGVWTTLVRHNDMDKLEDRIRAVKADHDQVWYIADGLYSMYGDYAPLDRLERMLDTHRQLHLYIDDAHGMSWTGPKGTGYVRSQIDHHERMVLAVSLNKAFAAAGGAFVFPDEEMARLVRTCGSTSIFSGPIQPPMLGAACASARLHLSGAIAARQERLTQLIAHANRRLNAHGLPQLQQTDSPVFFVSTGLPSATMNLVQRMKADGFLLNVAGFPAAPMRRGGVRFVINVNLQEADIDRMVERLAFHYPLALEEEGSSVQAVAKSFGIPAFEVVSRHAAAPAAKQVVTLTRKRSVRELDAEEWDRRFASRGNLSVGSLEMAEAVFSRNDKPEDCWDFHYITVEDGDGAVVLQTFYTVALMKDDMLAPAEVSRRLEQERERDPYHLTSRCVMLGSMVSKGEHLYLDRAHPEWKLALRLLIEAMQQTVDEAGASQILLREFVGDPDEELQEALLELGLFAHRLPDLVQVRDLSWKDEAEYMQSLGSRYRQDVRREIKRHADEFEVVHASPRSLKEVMECYRLYENVFERSFELNVFKLPFAYFSEMCRHPDYRIIRLYLKGDPRPGAERAPVAVMFSYVKAGLYGALIVGLDYEFLRGHETYKQILHRTVWDAWELGCDSLDLAYTAEAVKKKVGGRCYPSWSYVQLMDHFNQALIATMAHAS